MKYLGCAYYPEYWGIERVETDARLMKEAGINAVRIGEFAWTRMEPANGCYDLDWLHESIEILGKYGINVLMCTPTATPPAWLTSAYPETCIVRADGSRLQHGHRRHYCSTSETYRKFSRKITDVLSRELSKHENIVAWQLDNEFGPETGWCYCENCQSFFQSWLKKKYGSIEELNRRWGTGFWSVDYSDWNQVRLGCIRDEYSSRNLDSRRFWSDMMIDFAMEQAEIIRRNCPCRIVTTNGMGPIYTPIDYYKLFSTLDVACDDLYYDIPTQDGNVLVMNFFRSIKPKQRYWITETGAGALDSNRPPHPDQFRAWAWSNLAHGGETHFVFRWRSCLSGQEQELEGILEHSGEPRHRYNAVKRCFTELRSVYDRFNFADLPLPEAQAAIVLDYQTIWGYESSRMPALVNHLDIIYRLHKALYNRNIIADIIPPGRDLSGYKLIFLPNTVIIAKEFAKQIAEYVRNGGVVLALGQLGMRDANDNYLPYPGPDGLQELFGCKICGGMYLLSHVGPDEALGPVRKETKVKMRFSGKLGNTSVNGTASMWAADLSLTAGGKALMTFKGDTYDGQPAVVGKTTGKGKTIYAGTLYPDDRLYNRLVDYGLKEADVARGPAAPEYVEVVRRSDIVFIVNHRNEQVRVRIGGTGKAILGSFSKGTAKLPAYGVCVIKRSLSRDRI